MPWVAMPATAVQGVPVLQLASDVIGVIGVAYPRRRADNDDVHGRPSRWHRPVGAMDHEIDVNRRRCLEAALATQVGAHVVPRAHPPAPVRPGPVRGVASRVHLRP